ncbi:MAG: DUF2335 domain-containing protein [Chloroflexaceae bacterium]|nr:DUF2335 domain-containing protein [Chloroflexaceae bacterium]
MNDLPFDTQTQLSLDRESSQDGSSLTPPSVQKVESLSFVGPIPPPALLEQYNRVQPDAANRIIAMAEREEEHRHKMQEKLINAEIADRRQGRSEKRVGQIFGFSIGTIAIVAGSIVAVMGAQVPGTFIGLSGVTGLVSVFVIDRRSQQPPESSSLEDFEQEDP